MPPYFADIFCFVLSHVKQKNAKFSKVAQASLKYAPPPLDGACVAVAPKTGFDLK
jgi:hypothetical protein